MEIFYVTSLIWFNVLIFVSNAFIPNEWLQFSSKYTFTHVEITERAILDVATDYFLKHPRPSQRVKPLSSRSPYNSATDLFIAYYGNNASPRKFEEAIKELTTANANVDLDLTVSHLAAAHFDAEQFVSGNQRLLSLRQAVVSSIIDGHFEAARGQCGQLLHTLQDFYSHSNWIEIGQTDDLNPHLGVSGGNLGKLADPTLPTCIDCGSKSKTCKNNVLNYIKINNILTSGYSEGQVNSQGRPIHKPPGIGKCSHGGGSSNTEREAGGINKDTSSPHLSPHFYYHKKASHLAIKATVTFLQNLRESVGESAFARFLNLGLGSTLCIVMDISGSMRNDMDAAINRSYHIIDSRMGTDAEPANFVLVPFHDPVFGPATVTDNADHFKSALNNLKTKDGGDCPELALNGLRLALTNSEPYSSCFVFTDASAKDEVMRDSVVALAQHKKIEVSFFVSGKCWHSGHTGRRRRASRTKKATAGNKLYSDIAFSTGGQALDLTKKDILEGTQIIESTVQLSKVSLFKAYDLPPTTNNGRAHVFPIDLTLTEVTIEVNGYIEKMNMIDPKGTSRKIGTTGKIKFIANLPTLHIVKMTNLVPGMWKIRVNSFMSYSVSVYGLSTLDFIHTFGKSVTDGPHPGHKEIGGRPLKGKPAHIMMKIFGAIGQDIARMEQMDLVNIKDKILNSKSLQKISPISQYTAEAIPPDIPFLVRLVGRDGNGNVIHRLLNTVVEPSTTEIIAYASTKNSTLAPGGSTDVRFTVFNIGKPAAFRIKATDEKDFVQMVTPDRVNLQVNDSADGYITLAAPKHAAFGTTSTVTLTVHTNTAGQTFNFMVFDVIVAPQDLDEDPPTCTVVETKGDCSTVGPTMDCKKFNYTVTASFMDIGYGLYDIQAKYPTQTDIGRQNVDHFQVGLTNQSVKGVFHSTCCHPKFQLIAIDVVGNVGRCVIEINNISTSPVDESNLSTYILIACIGLAIVGLLILVVICIICRKRIRNKVIFIR
ncbi:von Willebrand factor A domain-containing protein 7-like [Antedon mediterranea]|uniref:von Willebrand factor A domain-containing protein 7-like n=1 Tax=Antedon mediterranea TaxID=105859 RepID=UPI003AF84637